jgi:hypothetical protein
MPEVYEGSDKSIGLWIMVGFFIQIILELFSEGIRLFCWRADVQA